MKRHDARWGAFSATFSTAIPEPQKCCCDREEYRASYDDPKESELSGTDKHQVYIWSDLSVHCAHCNRWWNVSSGMTVS